MLKLKRILFIPLILVFFITSQMTALTGYAKNYTGITTESGTNKSQTIKEFDGGKLSKVLFQDGKVKDVVYFNDGRVEDYDEVKHGKYFTKDKMSKKLKEKTGNMVGNEKVPVSIWISDIDHKIVEQSVKEKLKISDIKKESPEKIRAYIKEKRIKSKEEYAKINKKFADKYVKKDDIVHMSGYSPLIIANLLKEDIDKIYKDSEVQAMDLFVNTKKEEDSTYSLPNINAKYVRDTLSQKGNGANVGILEVGYPNKNNSELTNRSITFDVPDSTAMTRLSTHATIVTSIIMGQTQGIAPDATAYVAAAPNRLGDYQKIEWLLDQEVTVINYSAGYSDIKGQYSDMAKWIDHLGAQHDAIFVKSAGNVKLSDYSITDPGMAYNAVTVSSINDHDSTSPAEPYWGDDTYSSFSCYTETSGPFKPDVSAPGEGINIAGYTNNNGTSYSAPHVTGVLAQIIGAYPGLFPRNSMLKALITACTRHKTASDYGQYQLSAYLSDREGGGVIDARRIYECITNSKYLSENLSSSQFPYTHYFSVNATGQPVRVSLAWGKNNTIATTPHPNGNVTARDLSDLDLVIYDPNGRQVGYSMTANNNVEIVEFTPAVSGNYRINVDAYTLMNDNEQISIAWD